MMNLLTAVKCLVLLGGIWCSLASQADGLSWSREQAATPKSGVGTRFAVDQLSLVLPLAAMDNRSESLTSKLKVTRTEFSWAGSNALSGTYYWLALPLYYQQKRSRQLELVARLEPGVMTDTHVSGWDTLQADGELSARWHNSGSSFWQFGAIVDRDFGDQDIYPLAAFSWQADRVTQVQLGFPYSYIQTTWSRQLNSYAQAKPAGGVWLEKGEQKIRYRSWQLATGINFLWREDVWLNLEVGGLFKRNIKASDSAGGAVAATPKNNLFWGVAMGLAF